MPGNVLMFIFHQMPDDFLRIVESVVYPIVASDSIGVQMQDLHLALIISNALSLWQKIKARLAVGSPARQTWTESSVATGLGVGRLFTYLPQAIRTELLFPGLTILLKVKLKGCSSIWSHKNDVTKKKKGPISLFKLTRKTIINAP